MLIGSESLIENVVSGTHTLRTYSAADQIFRWGKVAADDARMRERAADLLSRVGISEFGASLSVSVPYGARKLTDILRATIGHPRLLLLDEPTSGLGRDERNHMVKLLRNIRAEHEVTVLFVEHHMDTVREAATRIIGLQAGQVIADGNPIEVLESDEFRRALVR
jgi:branched-chain amino acid transport system ATP-binding protein